MSTPLAPICRPCQEQRDRWFDYRLPRTPGIACGSGAPYDVSIAGVRDRQRGRYEEWRAIIRFNRDLIARTCREQRHADPAPQTPAAVVIQMNILDLLDPQQEAA